jgi:predicted DNA-binding protein
MKSSSRLTVDMDPEEHTYLKMASAQLGITMREFILWAAFKKMAEIDDQWLADKAGETLRRLESRKASPHKQKKTESSS